MIRKTLASLALAGIALGVPAALVLGTSTSAQACFFIASGGVAPSCSGGGGGATYTLTPTPSVTSPGDPITLTLTRATDTGSGDVTPGSTFSISSGTCVANVCRPDALGTLTVSGRYTVLGDSATTSVQVVPPDHLVVVPASADLTAGSTVAVAVSRAAADGTILDDDTALATVTFGGAPCPGAVCTATTAGNQVVTATDGSLVGSAVVRVQAGPPASLVVVPGNHEFWNNASPVAFGVSAYDAEGNALGDVTASSMFAVSPDGSCSGNACTTATGGSHTVTATYGSLVGTVTLDAAGPTPMVAPTLPDGRVGTRYSASVLAYGDSSTRTELDAASHLPPGLALGADGILSGVPTQTGSYSFSVIAVNANGSQNSVTTISIAPGTVAATPKISAGNASVREGNSGRKVVQVPVRLSAPSSTPVTISWHTVNGTAVAGNDYVAAHGTVTIPAGQLTASIPVSIIGDKTKERNETFTVVLTSPHGATLGTARGIVTIANDD